MAERLLLETDVLIENLRGLSKAVEYLEGLTSDLYLSVISVAELFAGVIGDEEERSLKQFLSAFTVPPVTEKVARLDSTGETSELATALTSRTLWSPRPP